MRCDFLPVFKREVRSYLHSPSLYITLGMYLFISGLFLFATATYFGDISREQAMNPLGKYEEPLNFTDYVVRHTFGAMSFLYLFLAPIITMRLIAEERTNGTMELLATAPLSDWGIVLGKFLAVVAFNLTVLALSLGLVGFMAWLGPVEWPQLWSCVLAVLLLGLTYCAFGLFASAISRDQVSAAVITFIGLLTFFLLKEIIPARSGRLADALTDLSINMHSEPLLKGQLRLQDLVYFILAIVFFLFLSHTVLKARQWKD